MAAMATPTATATATTAAATTTNNNNHDGDADDVQTHAPLLPSPPTTDAAAEGVTAASTAMTPSTLATAERARLTAVLGELVRDDSQRRSCDVWRRECAAGRHWKALVARFGAGVALVKPRLLGLTTKGCVCFQTVSLGPTFPRPSAIYYALQRLLSSYFHLSAVSFVSSSPPPYDLPLCFSPSRPPTLNLALLGK
jgi:hypothetical protein